MPFAPVDDVNTELFYQDSGVPILNDRPYTTLVAMHGHSWNSYIFTRLLPLAQASHIRLVLLNRRGYGGSTSYSDDETAGIEPDVDSEHTETPVLGHTAFLQRRGVEIARFLAWFIEKEEIPPLSSDENVASGGISLMGWSIGNKTTLSFLAFANTFDPTLIKKLEGYLRKVIIYDPPHHALGYHTPTDSYNPLKDLSIPAGPPRRLKYTAWICSYFVHSPVALELDSSLREPINSLEQRTPNSAKETTMSHISAEDIQAGLENDADHGDEFLLLPQARPAQEIVRLRAIFGDLNETSVPVALPRVGVSYIWCTQSVWETVLAARLLKQEIAKPPGYSYPTRRVKFFALEGNHFAHWDEPLKTFAMLAAAIE